jgi:hypothetical protein
MMRTARGILLHGIHGFVLTLTLLSLCPSAARLTAQSAITGTVTDSLSAGHIAGSTIQLVSANNPAQRLRETTTNSEGAFRFDAVPADRYLIGLLDVRLDALGIEPYWTLDVRSGDSLVRTNLVLPAGASAHSRLRTARLTGRVHTLSGQVPASAQVMVWGEDGIQGSSTVDSIGVFALEGLTPGAATLEVRSLGYEPTHILVDLTSTRTAVTDITLGNRISRLDTLRVFGRPPIADFSGFDERLRKNWFGHFLTAEKIDAMHVATLTMALATIPGLQIVGSEVGSRVTSSRRCVPSVYLDGFQVYNGETALDDIVTPNDVRGIEVYLQPGTAPLQYGRNECGAILVWTKRK